MLQIGLYGALGPAAAAEGATYLHVHAQWWVWALGAWAIITILGVLRVEPVARRAAGRIPGWCCLAVGPSRGRVCG